MTSNITSSSESIVPNPHLTPTSPPPITFPRSGTANTRYILYRAPVPSTSKRSYRLTVITKDSAQLYITFEGRVSYRGRRAQPPVDTIEWWEIVDLLLAVQFRSFSLILFLGCCCGCTVNICKRTVLYITPQRHVTCLHRSSVSEITIVCS